MRCAWLTMAVVGACGSENAPPPKPTDVAALPSGPAPVAIPPLDSAKRRAITKARGYLIIDASGGRQWGHLGKDAPYQSHPLKRGEFAIGHVVDGEARAVFPDGSVYEEDLDSFGKLARDTSVDVLVLADAATPARIAMVEGLQSFGNADVTLAAGDANTTVAYTFSLGIPNNVPSDLTLHVDDLKPLTGTHPKRVMIEITDATTTGQLVTALGALSAAGVPDVRIHRLMGWGEIPLGEIVDVKGAGAEDDVITKGEPAKVEIGDPELDDHVDLKAIANALKGFATRFRYCFEKRGLPKLHGSIEVTFDIAANGDLTSKRAVGLDSKIASCVQGALFDLEIAPGAIHAAGHAKVAITFNAQPPPAAAAPIDGFWCTSNKHQWGGCPRSHEECDVMRDLYAHHMRHPNDLDSATPCEHEQKAWTSDGAYFFPTKELCSADAASGVTCHQVK